MIIAIHQPNYIPWFGYFAKIAQADIFVFLDDVQFSKNSYTNRVQVLNGERRHWLTVPVHVKLGHAIDEVHPAKKNWIGSHQDTLVNFYRRASAYREVWPSLRAAYDSLPEADLAAINCSLIESVARNLELPCRFVRSSELGTGEVSSDERLAEIAAKIAPGGTYLSGSGGANYQQAETFDAHGITLRYSQFTHPNYEQGDGQFESGLSIIDAILRLGWLGTRDLLMASVQ